MTDGGPSSSLWLEGVEVFRESQSKKSRHDKAELDEFLADTTSLQDAKASCVALQQVTDKKYSEETVPKKWLARILDSLGKFITIGDFVMAGAPETIGLAWFAVKQIANAIQDNYKLYATFGEGLTLVTEMLVLIRTYDTLFDKRDDVTKTQSGIVGSLLAQIRQAYAAVLDFSFLIKRHVQSSVLRRVGHVAKAFLGIDTSKVQAKVDAIRAAQENVLRSSQAATNEKALETDELLKKQLSAVAQDVVASMNVQKSLQEMIQKMQENFKEKSRYDWATQAFRRVEKALNPLNDEDAIQAAYLATRLPGTCEYILSDEIDFKKWVELESNCLLWIHGDEGFGKSVLLAHMIQNLKEKIDDNSSWTILFASCEPRDTVQGMSKGLENSDSPGTFARLQQSLIYQLYKLALPSSADDDPLLLEQCTVVLSGAGRNKGPDKLSKAKRGESAYDGPDLDEALREMSSLLEKDVYLIIDAVDRLSDEDQAELLSHLGSALSLESCRVKCLISHRSSPIGTELSGIDNLFEVSLVENNKGDIASKVRKEIQQLPGWTRSEQEEAFEEITHRAGSWFRYVDVAIGYLKQPLTRPYKAAFKDMPSGIVDVYSRFLQQLSPNYLSLLTTTLTWSLMADRSLTVSEIMDIYTGAFLDQGMDDDSEESIQQNASDLAVKQIEAAGGPFLDVKLFEGHKVVVLKEPSSAERFFVRETDDNELTIDEVCNTCGSKLGQSHHFGITAGSAHMELAIRCLQHLNSRLFKLRHVDRLDELEVSDWSSDSSESSSSDDAAGSTTAKLATDTGSVTSQSSRSEEGSESDEADSSSDSSDENDVLNYDESSVVSNAEESNVSVDSDPDFNGEQIDRHNYDFEEDEGSEEEEDDDDENDLYDVRYEIAYWDYHVRTAENICLSAEGGGAGELALLWDHLDQFMSKDSEPFKAWQRWELEVQPEKEDYYSALEVAVYYGFLGYAGELLRRGESAKSKPRSDGSTLLDLAADSLDNDEALLRLLLSYGADPNYQEKGIKPVPAFHEWIMHNSSPTVVKQLLQNGARCDITSQHGSNVMHFFAANGKSTETLQMLLEHGALINVKDKVEESPLHILLRRRNLPIDLLRAFIENGADVNQDDKASERPLLELSRSGNVEAFDCIIEHVQEIDDRDANGRTALHSAAQKGHLAIVDRLLRHGADPNAVDDRLRTPLYLACQYGRTDTAKRLLDELVEKGIEVNRINKPTNKSKTPLRKAAGNGLTEIVTTILDLVRSQNDDSLATTVIDCVDTEKSRTALHCAAVQARSQAVQLLLTYGANANLKDKVSVNTGEIMENLENAQESRQSKSLIGRTPLQLCYERWAVSNSDEFEPTLTYLIDHDIRVAKQDARLLSIAAAIGSETILERLLSGGDCQNVNEPDEHGWTPLLLAKQYGRTRAVEMLTESGAEMVTKPERWHLSSPFVQTSEDGREFKTTDLKRGVVIVADHPIPSGIRQYYFEITVQYLHPRAIIAVGMCTHSAEFIQFPGIRKKSVPGSRSWAYISDTGNFTTTEDASVLESYEWFGEGNTVGCGYSAERSSIFFTLNGEKIEFEFQSVGDRLFPVIGVVGQAKISTEFGLGRSRKPFVWTEQNKQ